MTRDVKAAAGVRPTCFVLPDIGFSDGMRLFRAWDAARAETGERLPTYRAFNPFDVASLMPRLTLFEFLPPETLLFHLHGDDMREMYGQNLSRKVFEGREQPQPYRVARVAFAAAVTQPCGLYLEFRFSASGGRTGRARVLYLPLAPENRPGTKLIGVTEFLEVRVGIAPRPLEVAATDALGYIDLGAGLPSPPDWSAKDERVPGWFAPAFRRFG